MGIAYPAFEGMTAALAISDRNINVIRGSAALRIPRISIGVPVFNGGETIHQALTDLRNQTVRDFELIISDNASTDDTERICRKHAEEDDRIIYIRQLSNKGAPFNFRYVLDLARGDYFMWAAADDRWYACFLEECLKAFSGNDVVSVTPRVRMGQKPTSISGTFPLRGPYLSKLTQYLSFKGSNSRFYGLSRREVLKASCPNDDFHALDLAIIVAMLKHGIFEEVDACLMWRSDTGISKRPLTYQLSRNGVNGIRRMFPLLPFTWWLLREVGPINFLKLSPIIMKRHYRLARRMLRERVVKP